MSFSLHASVVGVVLVLALSGCSLLTTSVQPSALSSQSAVQPTHTGPTPAAVPEPSEAERAVDAMNLDEQIRSLLLLHRPGTDGQALTRFLARTGGAGVIMMPDNVTGTSTALRSLVDDVTDEPAALVAIDQEGGPVARLRGDSWPSMRELAGGSVANARRAFTSRAQLLQRAGVTVNFGIVADVASGPSSYMWSRSAGPSVAAVSDIVEAAVQAENGRVYSTLKHFPGHGIARGDSHSSLPSSPISFRHWSNTHAVPFARGIEAGADLVMMGHLRLTSLSSEPASLSRRWVSVLRNDMGFNGVIVTDDILMLSRSGVAKFADPIRNSVNAVAAGNDLVLLVLPRDPSRVGFSVAGFVEGIHEAIAEGRVSMEQIRQSAIRVMKLRTGTP